MHRLLILLCFIIPSKVFAEEVYVAVASNFFQTANDLRADFKKESGHIVKLSSGSSGKLFAQIMYGAPFDIFMSADSSRTRLLVDKSLASNKHEKPYVRGKLLFVAEKSYSGNCAENLKNPNLKRIALANPFIAPYGMAAKEVLIKMSLWKNLSPQLIRAENVAQVLQFLVSGNVQAAFIAKSQLSDLDAQFNKNFDKNSYCTWDVPQSYYAPIEQRMALLGRAKYNVAAISFWEYLSSDRAKKIMSGYHYEIPK